MREPFHTEQIKNLTLNVYQDECCECDPRDNDNLGVMACFHGSYTLGDDVTNIKKQGEHYFHDASAFREFSEHNKPIMLPLYLYDHSGITMSTGPFGCPWDSGQVGWIFCSLDKACREYSVKRVTPTIRRKVLSVLEAEVRVYDEHIQGNCFGVVIEDDSGNLLESCWGYHGYKCIDWDYMLSEHRETAKRIATKLVIGAGI